MNLFLLGIIIFVIAYLLLNWFARVSSKKIAHTIKKIAVYLSLFVATVFTIGGFVGKVEKINESTLIIKSSTSKLEVQKSAINDLVKG